MRHVRINCAQDNWKNILKNAVEDGVEAELINFDYSANGRICELLVMTHALHFVFDPKAHAGFLKKLV
jgi:hypothetical protein